MSAIGRAYHRFLRNWMLALSGSLTLLGVALLVVSFFTGRLPDAFTTQYLDAIDVTEGNENRIVQIVSILLLIFAGYYVGEQIYYRRKFGKLIDTAEKSVFAKHRRRLEELATHLPESYTERIEAKETSFKSRR
ncbi:MAG: hypothetical protein ACT4PT_07840 [Methanobacteriota archaeon]